MEAVGRKFVGKKTVVSNEVNFSEVLSGLISDTYYRYKAYAITDVKTHFGEEISFKTAISSDVKQNNTDTLYVYPNPINDHLVVDFGKGFNIYVTNQLGQKVFYDQIEDNHYNVDTSKWNSGLYIMTFVKETAQCSFKIVK